jgi:hypothetical protein
VERGVEHLESSKHGAPNEIIGEIGRGCWKVASGQGVEVGGEQVAEGSRRQGGSGGGRRELKGRSHLSSHRVGSVREQ